MSSDVQLAIQLQLAEIDERDAPTNNLLSKPQNRFPESSVSKDSALKWAISDEEHAIARDAAFAQSVAQKDLGHPRLSASGAGPSSNPTSASPPHSACSPLCSAQNAARHKRATGQVRYLFRADAGRLALPAR